MSRDCFRALTRGLGQDRRADPMPLEALVALEVGKMEDARFSGWLAAGLDVAIVQCSWLTREIQSSGAASKARWIQDECEDGSCSIAPWDLPVSKVDPQTLGKWRTPPCSCPCPLCPMT